MSDDPDYNPIHGAPYSHDQTKILKDDTYHWIGRCIARWGYVDNALFDICAWAMRADQEVCAVVYYRTPSLDARISLTNDLMDARFIPNGLKSGEHAPHRLKKWRKLKGRLDEKEFRNFIAHNHTVTLGTAMQAAASRYPYFSMTDQAMFASRVTQPSHDRNRRKSKYDLIGPTELREHYKAVCALRTDLQTFHTDLQAALPVELSPQSDEDLQRIRDQKPCSDRE